MYKHLVILTSPGADVTGARSYRSRVTRAPGSWSHLLAPPDQPHVSHVAMASDYAVSGVRFINFCAGIWSLQACASVLGTTENFFIVEMTEADGTHITGYKVRPPTGTDEV